MSRECFSNGINANNGDYLLPPLSVEQLSAIAQELSFDPRLSRELQWRSQQEQGTTKLALEEGLNPKDLAQAGWGVIFPRDLSDVRTEELRDALNPLLSLRRSQAAARNERLYREFIGEDGYRSGEDKLSFLERNGAGPGPVEPCKVPYYLLIVGSPKQIPFEFQYQLDVQHAVGRVHFRNTQEYGGYARSIVDHEHSRGTTQRRIALIGTEHEDDPPTQLSLRELVVPLAAKLSAELGSWTLETYLSTQAKKDTFRKLFGGEQSPTIVFSATHGVGFNYGNPQQCSDQGALLCQEWPGSKQWKRQLPQQFYFSSADVTEDASVAGSLFFNFACYSAGTPDLDEFSLDDPCHRRMISPQPFVAQLPQRLLSHSNGGALAVVGHVDRAWGYSFLWENSGRQLAAFTSVFKRLMTGHPVGSALEPFNSRYAELATLLTEELHAIRRRNKIPDPRRLALLWTAQNDSRGYVIIGDPAVRIGPT